MPKITYTIKIESVLLKRIQRFAEGSHRSVNNFIELSLIEATKGKPQKNMIDEHSPENIESIKSITDATCS